MSRRAQIRMDEREVADFLAAQRVMVCATNGRNGFPHLMPLWYVLRPPEPGAPGPQLWAWTYAASQKARNLERDPRATLQVESGEEYQALRGVMLECDVRLHRDVEQVAALGTEIFRRYLAPRGSPPLEELPDAVATMIATQAPKRVGLQFLERSRATWDHRKLGGTY